VKRVQFEFADETYKAIHELADLTGETSMAAVIRDALKAYAWLVDEQRRGRRIISQDLKDPKATRELVALSATVAA